MLESSRKITPSSDSPDLSLLRQEFKRLRRERRITQIDIASQLGVTQSSISGFESGKYVSIQKSLLDDISRKVKEWRTTGAGAVIDPSDPSTHSSEISEDERSSSQVMRKELIAYLGGDAFSKALVREMGIRELRRNFFKMQIMSSMD